MKIGAILLAAGSSSRMGQSKQMLDVNGQPLLKHAAKAVIDAGISPAVVVLGANEKEHRQILENTNIDIALNSDWELGMGASIRSGLQYLMEKYPDITAVLIVVCDQPVLTAAVLSEIITRFRETRKPVVASQYQGTAGVPVLFAQTYFKKLQELPDDQGAKKLIHQNPSDVAFVQFQGGEIDLDTIDDYKTFLSRQE